ncbi:MAG TPA: hypothetical protein VK604_24175 [Bryobacteraceae bacterium]|nr:hypothetical protein [Bryobacteraceae bacterium]
MVKWITCGSIAGGAFASQAGATELNPLDPVQLKKPYIELLTEYAALPGDIISRKKAAIAGIF